MILLVLGMHRSGTSAVTRTLALMGAEIPGTLMAPAAGDNPLGFWESREIADIHDRFLTLVDSDWQDMRPLPETVFQDRAARICRDDLTSLLRGSLMKSPLLVVKDPRLCRLMPLWRPVLRGLGEQSRAVLPIRNPLEVARSLELRNGIEREQALMMWLVHSLLAERESRDMPRQFVPYGAFLASPRERAAALAESLGMFNPVEVEAALPEIETFWRRDLRHHEQSDAELRNDPAIPTWVREAYHYLSADSPPSGALDALSAEVERAMEGVGRYLDPTRLARPAQLEAVLSDWVVEVDALESRLADAAGTVAERDRWLAEREALLTQRTGEALRSESEAASLRDRLQETLELLTVQTRATAEKDALAASLGQSLAEKDAVVIRQTEWLREKDEQIARAVARLKELEEALAARAEHLRERDLEIARTTVRLRELGQALIARDDALTTSAAHSADQARRLAEAATALARQAGQLDVKTEELVDRNRRLAGAVDAAALQAERLGEKEAALAAALDGMEKQTRILAALEEDHQALARTAERSSRSAASREADLLNDLRSLKLALEEARAAGDALQDERRQDAETLAAFGVAISDLEASLDRQRTHLAVLAFTAGKRRG